MLEEFKKFISRGNVVDLAVGVIIGSAFSAIVTSLVNNIFTPLLGVIFGGVDFSGLSITFRNAEIMYGEFIQNVIDFLITAVCLFVVVKVINNFNDCIRKFGRKKEVKVEVEVKEEVKKADDILLLEEIRDLLKESKVKNKVTKEGKDK